MSTYRNTATGEVREFSDELIAAWEATNNPKRQEWEAYTPPAPEPPPPEPRWVAFGAVLLADPAVNQMLRAALTAAPAVALSIPVGLGKAADGDSRVFMVSWAGAAGIGLISAELIAHVQELAADYDLPPEFIAGLAPA
jgi:hypothetical protein